MRDILHNLFLGMCGPADFGGRDISNHLFQSCHLEKWEQCQMESVKWKRREHARADCGGGGVFQGHVALNEWFLSSESKADLARGGFFCR